MKKLQANWSKFTCLICITLFAAIIVQSPKIVQFKIPNENDAEIKMPIIRNWDLMTLSTLKSIQFSATKENQNINQNNPFSKNNIATKLGRQLFFDTNLSKNEMVSCSTCHNPNKEWSDTRQQSSGLFKVIRNAPSLTQSKYQDFQTWDGRRDSLWSQSLEPLLNQLEHGLDLNTFEEKIQKNKQYVTDFLFLETLLQQNFQSILSNQKNILIAGFSIGAFLETLSFSEIKLDIFSQYIDKKQISKALNVFNFQELHGLDLFLNKGQCVRCHSGPLLSDKSFHNIGVAESSESPNESGWIFGSEILSNFAYNCTKLNLNHKFDCTRTDYLLTHHSQQVGAFRTPSLRNARLTAPYMHNGQIKSFEEIVTHYDNAISKSRGESEIVPLHFTQNEKENLVSFLKTLDSKTSIEELN